jgi:hypothetical protein
MALANANMVKAFLSGAEIRGQVEFFYNLRAHARARKGLKKR